MSKQQHTFDFNVFDASAELPESDRLLLETARKATENAYAPYSGFDVAAVARLSNGEMIAGTNQENASFPVGICAERTLLSVLASQYAGVRVDAIAISYTNRKSMQHNEPVSPCGLCRQSLLEYEQRLGHPIRLILAGQTGRVLVLSRMADLLPFAFGADDLG